MSEVKVVVWGAVFVKDSTHREVMVNERSEEQTVLVFTRTGEIDRLMDLLLDARGKLTEKKK
jgi:hypothetical protein